MNAIRIAWKGDEKLWKVFWLYNFILGSALMYAMDYAPALGLVLEGAVYLVALAWAVWIFVALWRCAFNTDWKGWGYITRGIVVLGLFMSAISLVGLFMGIDPESL